MTTDLSNSTFQKAVAFVNQTNRHIFLTGKAGTGKTTFLKYLKEHSYKKMAIVAPTGVAAVNAGGVTLHSFFQLPLGAFVPGESNRWSSYQGELNNRSTLLRNLRLPLTKRMVIQELELLVIDEISMVRADLLDAVDAVLRHVRKQPILPFGGVQMVYIGDLFQLPPVTSREEWDILQQYYASPFFFDAQVLQVVPPLYIELKKIYRQKDDSFINVLNNVRNNCCTRQDLELLDRYYYPSFIPPKEQHYITLTSHNSRADAINEQELKKLGGKVHGYDAKVTGEFQERSFPVEKQLQLKVGAQVMFIKNDKGESRRFYNGKIGTVARIVDDKIVVAFDGEEDEVELEQETWENIKYHYDAEEDSLKEEQLGTFTQYPIRLAWAITIHKSQGLTFEKAIIDAGASFAPGQVYVALSRLTNLEGLVLYSRITQDCISTDNRIVQFVNRAADENVLQEILEYEQKVFVRSSLTKTFSWAKLMDAATTFLENYEGRQIPDKQAGIDWATALIAKLNEQQEVAAKFIKQLEYLFTTCEQDNHQRLFERVSSAAVYFVKELEEHVQKEIRKHIEKVKVKPKVKRYVKELQGLLTIVGHKIHEIQQAVKLAEGLHKGVDISAMLEIVEKATRRAEPNSEVANAKPEKGETRRISLQMFKTGLPIADIAKERSMAVSTIEGHLASFVKTNEVDILDLINKRTFDKLTAHADANPEATLAQLKDVAGDSVSYGAVRAFVNYRELQKAE